MSSGAIERFILRLSYWLVLLSILLVIGSTSVAATTFSFTLDEASSTSAGVFKTDGTLVRTLWSKVQYNAAGTYFTNWDGLDDQGVATPEGTYRIQLLQYNTEYIWDGAIGNTSAETFGPSVHRGFHPLQDMTIVGTNAFYVSGYNEGQQSFRSFVTTDPNRVKAAWNWHYDQFGNVVSSPGLASRSWLWTAADRDRVYFACSATFNSTNSALDGAPGCIVASFVTNNGLVSFPRGTMITNGPTDSFPSGIYVGRQPGISGLGVQYNGILLAASVTPDNKIYFFDKISGDALMNWSVPSPKRLDFSPDNRLWVISGKNILSYTNLNTAPLLSLTISNLSNPLDVAVHPTNPNLVLVADGGSSQQLKAFDGRGRSVWTYGMPGGHLSNGVAVTTNKFWFSYNGVEQTFVCFAPDGSFWVGDEENHRALHFDSNRNYLEQIMWQPHSYVASVDQNNSSRVFNKFLEFKVDYTKPLRQSWTLMNNWKVNVDSNHISWNEGISEVTTFPNGRTYALVDNRSYPYAPKEICELTMPQLRLTGILPMRTNSPRRWVSLAPDGSVRGTTIGSARWYQAALQSFDANNNPIYSSETLLASAPEDPADPVPRCCSGNNLRAPISTNSVVVSYDSTMNDGLHLGGVRIGSTNWLWKTSPTGPLNGRGNFEIGGGLTYPGNTLQAIDRHIVYGYHGEFFRGQGQASQHMHFYDNGLFVGQFGEPSIGHSYWEGPLPGFAGGGISPSMVKTPNGNYHIWVNDEASHGPQRWQIANARNIREHIGSGAKGSSIILTNQIVSFPTAVIGRPGKQIAVLSWTPVANASAYKAYYSTNNGGPYVTFAGQTSTTNLVVEGLFNGQMYYFVVTAIVADVESTPSAQIRIRPFDTSVNVHVVGRISGGGPLFPVYEVTPRAVDVGRPSLFGAERLLGLFSLQELGNGGYGGLMSSSLGSSGFALFNWDGRSSNAIQTLPTFRVSVESGWKEISFLASACNIDTARGANYGLAANPVGTINIDAPSGKFHWLTVVSPARFSDPRKFILSLISANRGTASYEVDEGVGFSHIFQFLFRGNVTLTIDARNGANGFVQAVFLDQVDFKVHIEPPINLRVLEPAAPR
jgi:hypothetical protein